MRKISLNIGATFACQFLALLLSLATSIIVARSLGPVGNGEYSVAMLLPTFLVVFLNLGISSANVYYVGRHSDSLITAYRASILMWCIVTALGVGIGGGVILIGGDQWFPGVPSSVLWFASVLFPLGLLQSYFASLLQAVQDFKRFNVVAITSPAIMLFFVFFVFLLKGSVVDVVFAAVLTQFVNLIITFLLLHRQISEITRTNVNVSGAEYVMHALRYGYKAHLSNILTFVNYRADIFLINLLITPVSAGIYVISVAMSEKLWLISQAVSTVILPKLSELHAEEDVRRQLTPLIARWMLVLVTIAACFFSVLGPCMIKFLFGSEYLGAAVPFLFLLPGIVLASITKVLANDIAARGRPELNMYTSFVVIIFNIVGNLYLIPLWGLPGAAIATTIAYSVQAALLVSMYAWLSGNCWHFLFSFGDQDAKILKRIRIALSR